MKLLSAIAVILCGALANTQALAGMYYADFHGGHANFGTVGFHGAHVGAHGPHVSAGFSVFIGPPLFWPWYYPPAYYSPPAVYYNPAPTVIYNNPPVVYTNPPVEVMPSGPDYYPAPSVVAPGSPGSAVVELPPSNTAPRQGPAQQPPQAQSSDVLAQTPLTQLFMYPRQGQDEQQQARDREECYRWALGQIGYDPGKMTGGLSPTQTVNYYRAMGACLDGRGYSVR